jgi:hypothetical protein
MCLSGSSRQVMDRFSLVRSSVSGRGACAKNWVDHVADIGAMTDQDKKLCNK